LAQAQNSDCTMRVLPIILGLSVIRCEDDVDEIEDLEDLDEAVSDDAEEPQPLAPQFDADWEDDRKRPRLKACFVAVNRKVQEPDEAMHEAVKQVSEQHNVDKEQALSFMMTSMIMNCYANIDDQRAQEAASGQEITGDDTRALIGPPAEGQLQMDENHQRLLKEIVEEHRAANPEPVQRSSATGETPEERAARLERMKRRKEGKPVEPKKRSQKTTQEATTTAAPPLPLGMGLGSGVLYIAAVFGAMFGGVFLFIRKLDTGAPEQQKPVKKSKKKPN